MFVGNSMTLHGIRPEIGWYNEWGMAASSKESDYVHLLKKNIRKTCAEAAFCVCQVSKWEMNYKKAGDILPQYEAASNFGADLIILRLIENVPLDGYDPDVFVQELDRLINFLNKTGKAKIIITTGFWKHPGDGDIRAYAKERGITCVELGDLGERDEMDERGIKYFPQVSLGWDPNPRYREFQPYIMTNNTPENIKKALEQAKEYIDTHELPVPLVTVNSWNEWTETSYLQPDNLYGYGYLDAVKEVFKEKN